jgi:predicted DNA-binding transcriptional regulator YafY
MPKQQSEGGTPTRSDSPGEGRYRQLEELLELAIELQGSHSGLTYTQIAERWRCSDKTAKRRVKALRSVFGDALVAERGATAPSLRFRLRHPVVSGAVTFSSDELAALEAAASAAHGLGDEAQARSLERLATKARALRQIPDD